MSLCSDLNESPYIAQQRRDAKLAPIRKRIIICCDGTWQSAVSGKKNVPSNVTRLCRAVNSVGTCQAGNQWQQIVWYDSGIGTTSLALGKKIEGATGEGMEGNIVEAYNFCVLNYNPGDQIMCFGFSRGAYTARAIAGLISDIGICSKHDLNQFPELWKVYKKTKPGERFYCSDLWYEWMEGKADENQGAKGDDFIFEKRAQGDWAQEGSRNIEVIGVYDTVGSLGIPEILGVKLPSWLLWWSDQRSDHLEQKNYDLPANIKHAFQALALDEHRNAFSPTLWYLPKLQNVTSKQIEDQKAATEKKVQEWEELLQVAIKLKASGKASDGEVNSAARNLNRAARELNVESRKLIKLEDGFKHQMHPRTLKQVWFPGYHADIGGGSDDTLQNEGNMEEMSSIVLCWMLDQVKPYISLDEEYLVKVRTNMELHISTLVERPRRDESWAAKIKHAATALKNKFATAVELPEKQRSYAWGTSDLTDSFTTFYSLNGSKRRTPGGYDLLDQDGQLFGDTFEYIHPVVGFRAKEVPSYKPIGPGIEYERRKIVDKEGRPCVVYKLGGSRKLLPEWQLGGLDSYERLVIAGKSAYDYVDELDSYLKNGIKTPRRSVWGVRDVDLGIDLSQATPDNFEQDIPEPHAANESEVDSPIFQQKRTEWSAEEVLGEEDRAARV